MRIRGKIMLRETVTENGKVRGLPGNDPRITVFKGIPFAAPPIGKNRWRAPQPVENWEGTLEAYEFGPISMQDTPGIGELVYFGNQLHSGQLELVIDNLPDDDRMERHYLGTEYLLIAVPEGNDLNRKWSKFAYSHADISEGKHLKGRIRYLNDMRLLNDQPFILLQKGLDTRRRCDVVFGENGIIVQSVYELNQLSSAFGIASSGLGLTVVSDTLIKHSLDWACKMQYYMVRSPEFTRDVYFYTMKNRLVTRTIKDFIDTSRELYPFSVYDPGKSE